MWRVQKLAVLQAPPFVAMCEFLAFRALGDVDAAERPGRSGRNSKLVTQRRVFEPWEIEESSCSKQAEAGLAGEGQRVSTLQVVTAALVKSSGFGNRNAAACSRTQGFNRHREPQT